MKLDITKNFNLKNIKLDLSRELNVSIDYIAADIEQGIDQGQQFGKGFLPNAASTIKKKGFNHPLKDTGSMKKASGMIKTKATKERQIATLRPSSKNLDKAEYNHFGTETIPARPFFGISEDSEKKCLAFAAQKIEKELRNA